MAGGPFNSAKIRPAVTYLGGKSLIARRIVPLFGEHHLYVEPFAGGLSVLLNKHRARREIVSDLNTDLIHFYRFLVKHPRELSDEVRKISYLRENFLWSLERTDCDSAMERALKFVVKHRMSRNGQGEYFFESSSGDSGSGWVTLPDTLSRVAERLDGVEILERDGLELVRDWDGDGVQFYIDPPYYPAVRVHKKQYDHELSSFRHVQLLRLLKNCKSSVVVSGYSCPLYEDELKEWDRHVFTTISRCSVSSGSNTKNKDTATLSEEVVWVKPVWNF